MLQFGTLAVTLETDHGIFFVIDALFIDTAVQNQFNTVGMTDGMEMAMAEGTNQEDKNEKVSELVRYVTSANSIVAFTGAGISTESGVPDFRSPNGVWATSQPVLYQDYLQSATAREEYWRQKSAAHDELLHANPNIAHQQLAEWEKCGMLRGIITQNIDRLHQRAGSQNVLELHGNALEMLCIDCGDRSESDRWVQEYRITKAVPPCHECGGRLKHATISFGQSLDSEVLETAGAWAYESDLFLVIGSSLVVEPAASLPVLAKRHGSRLAIMNRDATPHDARADLVIRTGIGEALSLLTLLLPEQGKTQ